MIQTRILIVADSPFSADETSRHLLNTATRGDNVEFKYALSTSDDDLQQQVLDFKPHLVCFTPNGEYYTVSTESAETAYIDLTAALHTFRQKQSQQQQADKQALFQSLLNHAALLAKIDDYAQAQQILAQTEALDEAVSASLRHGRDLLSSYTQIKGGTAEQVYRGAEHALYSIAISPDGQRLAAAGEQGTLVIFEAQSGALLQRLVSHDTEEIRSLCFAQSNQQLISAGDDGKIIRWQQKNPNLPWQKQSEFIAAAPVYALCVSPDGRLLASGGADNAITLWELDSGEKLLSLYHHEERLSQNALAFSPNGRYLASGSHDDTAVIWEVETGAAILVLAHNGDVDQVSWSADSQRLATASEDKTLQLWNIASGRQLRVLRGHNHNIFALTWFGDYLLSAGHGGKIHFWDSRSGVLLRLLQGHESTVLGFALHAGQLWSASTDGTIRRWSLKLPFQQSYALPSAPSSAAITQDLQHIAVGFASGDLAVYNRHQQSPVWQQESAHNDDVTRLTFAADGLLLASSSFDNRVKLWQVQNTAHVVALKAAQTLQGHSDIVHAVAFTPDGKTLATACYDGQIGLFNLQNQAASFIEDAHQGSVMSVEFDASGKQLLSTGYEDKRLKLWDLNSNPLTSKNFPIGKDGLIWATISPNGQKIVSVGREPIVTVYSKYPVCFLRGHDNAIYRAIFTPDSEHIVTVSSDGTVKFWQLELAIQQGKELFSFTLPTEMIEPSPVWDVAFRCHGNGALLAVPLARGQLQLYQLAYGQILSEDTDEQNRQQAAIWQVYLNTIDTLLQTDAIAAALQVSYEAGLIAQAFDSDSFIELKQHSLAQAQRLQAFFNGNAAPLAPIQPAPTVAIKPTIASESFMFDSAEDYCDLGIEFYKDRDYVQAEVVFAQGLRSFPIDFDLLCNDVELALVQGDKLRLQGRITVLQTLYHTEKGLYVDKYPAIMQFMLYLSDDNQSRRAVLRVIDQTDKHETYGWVFSDIEPVLRRQSLKRQKIAEVFIDFFEQRIDLATLKTRLKAF